MDQFAGRQFRPYIRAAAQQFSPERPTLTQRWLEKLQSIASRLNDPAAILKPITDVIAQIKDDQQSKELLRSLVQDEMSSAQWLLEANQLLNGTKTAA